MKNYTESSGSYKFLHKDYLGSVLAITDEAGNKLEQRHFDAWGNLTHLKIGENATITDKNQIRDYLSNGNMIVDRGYTSHEHFAEVGIIHMNGRLYDPLLRRFLNADENIQDMFNTQNYNKYGYVMNNPLMYNDPSGEFIGVILGIILSKAFLIGAAVGAASYLITAAVTGQKITLGGFFKAAIFGGISGYAAWGIGDIFSTAAKTFGNTLLQAGAHGLSQGVLGLVQGQSFLSSLAGGFLGSLGAAGFGKIVGNWAGKAGGQIFFGALSGGIGAELSGGNFWQGAVIGGIVAGLNHAMHEIDFDPPKEVLVRHYDAKYSVEEGKWILSVKSEGYQMVDIAGASDGYQVINIYNSKGSVVGSLQGNDAYHTFNIATKGKFVDTHNTIIRGKSTVTLGEFLEHTGKGIQSGSVAASPFTEGWSLVGVPAGKFVSFVGTGTKYYGYWMYRNYGGYKDGIQGTIIDAAVGNTLKKIRR